MADPLSSETATIMAPQAALASQTSTPISVPTADEGRFLPGTLVAGRYRIIALLGRGGMGEVYRATDLTLAQPVALKFLPNTGPNYERTLERFHNEVRIARQVSHPNVCRVYDIGEVDGMPYLSMEYVDGEDLGVLLQRIGRLPADRALEIARKICAGLAAAHDKGIMHRDLKPANIMLDRRGNALIMDFGLSAMAEVLHGAEARNGTPAYMAPEQLRGAEASAKSDIYALGLVLYELFTGRRAFQANTLLDLMRLQESTEIASMTSVASDIDPAVENVIRKCLQLDPARRPANPLSVAAALPGGDPLAAALAAGETPSPELVAASGKTGGLALKYSIPLALGLVSLIVAVPFLRNNVEAHSFTPLDLPPDALAAKVREHAASFGYTTPPVDSKYDLHWVSPSRGPAAAKAKTSEAWRRLWASEPRMQLGYRESPLPLIASGEGWVTPDSPAPLTSGMLEAWVTSKGDLRSFRAVPVQAPTAEGKPVDTQVLFKATGFDPALFQETEPKFTPLYAFDWRKAWKAHHPVLDVDFTIEASAWHGRITELNVLWPWTQPWRMPETNSRSAKDILQDSLSQITSGILLLFCALLAVRNLRAGRGDHRGARRVAAAIFLMEMLVWACSAHWVSDVRMVNIVAYNAASALAFAGVWWMLYMALEPAVRSRWPHAIVTWNRMLAGNWRDPLVNTHILYGALLGIAIAYGFQVLQRIGMVRFGSAPLANADAGVGFRSFLSNVTASLESGFVYGLLVFFVIFCLRVVCRKDWIAALASAFVFAAREQEVWREQIFGVVFYMLIFFLLAFALVRLGLVVTVFVVPFINLLMRIPGAQNLSHWYEWSIIAYPALLLAIVIYAFWRTSGEQILTASPPA